MNARLQLTIQELLNTKELIPAERRQHLDGLAVLISGQLRSGEVVLNFICTHNSRRSQISQAWAMACSVWYGLKGISCVSGGTEVTAFNRRAVRALSDQGFDLKLKVNTANPGYELWMGDQIIVEMYSKTYQQATLEPFIAIMTCSHADENCPLVVGAIARYSLPFIDPGHSDGAPNEAAVYLETANQIGREMLYLFSSISPALETGQ